jgi:uncharacterized delta-60 repeat protein
VEIVKKPFLAVVFLLLVIPHQVQAACEPSIPGDVSGDCKVDFNDFAIIASDWLKAGRPHEWVARYNGPDNSYDSASAIAIDSNDNVYVTGLSTGSGTYSDYATIKYSPDSNQPVWVARYYDPAGISDVALAVAVDSNDNIYVTGSTYSSGTRDDYATVKYSPDSNEAVWVARYNGPVNDFDSAEAIAVDSEDNIYVTGHSYGSGTSRDYTTIKYSPDSNQPVWVARYNGPGNGSDWAWAIAVDSNDNIYVTGSSYGSGTSSDYTTIKYSPDSNQPVWVARYNGPGNGGDGADAIAVDSEDNIYVTGSSSGSGTGYDYATIKYPPDSNQPVWVARYNSPDNGDDGADAITVDSNDNIYVIGGVGGEGGGCATVKYSPDSNQPVWVAGYNGGAEAIAVDSKDNIYVTGYSYGDYATIKYSPDSNEAAWVATYNGPGNGGDGAYAIAVDSNDNIYVTGGSGGSGTGGDYATIRYSHGDICTMELNGDLNKNCKVDLYDLGIFCQGWLEVQPACEPNIPADLTGDCRVNSDDFAMMAPDWVQSSTVEPNQKWVAGYNGPGNNTDWAEAIAVDSEDSIYVTGYSFGSGTYYDYATIKYSPDSNEAVWVARYNGPGNGNDSGYAIAIDSNDNIYVTGRIFVSATYYGYGTIKYSPDSNLPVWVATYNGPGNGTDSGYAIAIDSNDNIYMTGQSVGSGTDYDYATIKYSPDSNQPVWVARYNGPGNDWDTAVAIAVDSEDNIYVTGYSVGSGIDFDYATVKYSPDSNQPVWVARYHGRETEGDFAFAIALDSNDNIYVTGNSAGSGTSRDYATVKYSPDSNEPVWVARYNGPGNDNDDAYAIAVDSNDNIYVTGRSIGSGTAEDYATVKYSPDSNQPVWVARYKAGNKAHAIVVDSEDSIYVTGWSIGSGTSRDYATIKYSPDSNDPIWVARYNGPDNSVDEAEAIAVDSSGHIYVTGHSRRSGPYPDYATIKYSPDHTCTPKITGDNQTQYLYLFWPVFS